MSTTHKNETVAACLPNLIDDLSSADKILMIEEPQRHPQIIVDLKARRNSDPPIFKLPVEILSKIFQFTQDDYINLMDWTNCGTTFISKMDLAWIAVTHVCRNWRGVALNDPSLWTRPPIQHPKWTAVMLERSRMAGLHMSSSVYDLSRMPEHTRSSVISHIPRTIELTIRCAEAPVLDKLFTDLRTTVGPMLQRLYIDATSLLWGVHDPHPRIHANTFPGATKLRHLSLASVDIDWSSHLLSPLTTLSIQNVSDGTRPTPTKFLDILERMPGLKSLTLHDTLPTRDNLVKFTNIKRRRVPLLYLESLSIKSDVTECEFFWSNITTSVNLNYINILAIYKPGSDTSIPKLLAAIYNPDSSEYFEANSRSAVIFGTVISGIASELVMRTNNHLSSSLDVGHTIIPHGGSHGSGFTLNVDIRDASAFPIDGNQSGHFILSEPLNGIRWSRLSELNLTDLRVFDCAAGFSQTFSRTFGTLPELHTVMVGRWTARPLVDSLLMDSNEDPAVSINSIVLPGLRHIQFHHVVFNERYHEHAVETDRLQDCLMSRYERGVPIYSVSIEMCPYFSGIELETLEEIVVDVHWDGVECSDYKPGGWCGTL
ncbi:hypothetical protein D9619_003492 [Psilocybe cf. subviscida]|uniref:F-box domain-containing protein n=1 Tax=Psilocybe cf. subviscida TaxID=2480587 RepID=A0A8H5AYC7_9AGAR|nr:hypothetical protein D9619_003492 [Psilocybe cf. subviscida]